MFKLAAGLQDSSIFIGRLPLSQVLLANDSRYTWLILVPARNDVFEIYHLSERDRIQLSKESNWVQEKLADAYAPDSLNVAVLGNVVPQLHVHHIVRYKTDPAWPGPVWGHSQAVAYDSMALEKKAHELKSLLGSQFVADMDAEEDPENYAAYYENW